MAKMAKRKKQRVLDLDWDTAPDGNSGFSEVKLPGYVQVYYLNFANVPYDPANRVLWWIDIGINDGYDKVVMDFASDIPSAKREAEAAFLRLLKAPQLKLVHPATRLQ
jgi:hypothetical protein